MRVREAGCVEERGGAEGLGDVVEVFLRGGEGLVGRGGPGL